MLESKISACWQFALLGCRARFTRSQWAEKRTVAKHSRYAQMLAVG